MTEINPMKGHTMIIHRVKTGQTPESIAEEYGIPVQSLLSENGLTSDEPLVTGQELVILVPEVTYTVKTGRQPLFCRRRIRYNGEPSACR